MTTGPRSEVPGAGMGLGYDPVDESETTAEQLAKNRSALQPPSETTREQAEGDEDLGAEVLEHRERDADERGRTA